MHHPILWALVLLAVVSTGSAATTAGTTAEGTAVPDSSSPNPGMTEDTSTTRRTDAKPTGTMMDMTSITMTTDNSTGMLNSTETDYNGTTVNSSDVPQPPDSGQVRMSPSSGCFIALLVSLPAVWLTK